MKRTAVKVINRENLVRNNPKDWAILLGLLGFSGKLISRETGLSVPQVYYHLRREKISVRDYRNGESKIAEYFISASGSSNLNRTPLTLDIKPLAIR